MNIPQIGLGTWDLHGAECEQAVLWALEAGYRHIDTATMYGNEVEIGNAIKRSGVPREEIFITTKLHPRNFDTPEITFGQSLNKLQVDYVDLYLIHAAYGESRQSIWEQLIKFKNDGRARQIGVSNYSSEFITELSEATGVKPYANQILINPWEYPKSLIKYCQEQDIIVEAYTPLTRKERLADPMLVGIAQHYDKSPAQVLIRWGLQHNLVSIPKSSNQVRIKENFDVFDFDISIDDMAVLDSIS